MSATSGPTEGWALLSAISFSTEALRLLVAIILLRQENTHGRYYYPPLLQTQ